MESKSKKNGAGLGGKKPKSENGTGAGGERPRKSGAAQPPPRDEPPAKSGGGFAALQANATKMKGGPMVVVHEEEEDVRVKGRKVRVQSPELRGDSEKMYIKGEETDVISGDQLNRLLLQARKAR